jgi:hypothetical protein
MQALRCLGCRQLRRDRPNLAAPGSWPLPRGPVPASWGVAGLDLACLCRRPGQPYRPDRNVAPPIVDVIVPAPANDTAVEPRHATSAQSSDLPTRRLRPHVVQSPGRRGAQRLLAQAVPEQATGAHRPARRAQPDRRGGLADQCSSHLRWLATHPTSADTQLAVRFLARPQNPGHRRDHRCATPSRSRAASPREPPTTCWRVSRRLGQLLKQQLQLDRRPSGSPLLR